MTGSFCSGKSLNGWEPHVGGDWKVEDGALVCPGTTAGWLETSESFKIIPDQWNRYEIRADGDHFLIVLNGKTLLDTRDSKHAAGVIGFQCQKNNRIEFRNIRLLPIRK